MWTKIYEQVVKFRPNTAQKMKFSIKDFFSKCDQICSFLQIRLHLLKKSLMKNFIFYAVKILQTLVKEIFVCLANFIENPIILGNSPNEVRFPLVVLNFKDENNFDKINLSLLPSLSKFYEKLDYQQLNAFSKTNYHHYFVVFHRDIELDKFW